MNRVGIIGAMSIEVDFIKSKMTFIDEKNMQDLTSI